MRVNEDIDCWVVIGAGPDLRQTGIPTRHRMGPAALARPPHPQQLHLDIRVDDAERAE
jgi:hypothetical protein